MRLLMKWMGNPPRVSCCEGSLSIISLLPLLLLAVLPFYIFKCVLKSIHVFSIISAAGFLKETRRRLKAFTRVVLVSVRIMSNGIEMLSKVSTTNVCRRVEDVLLNTLEDELHTKVPLLLKTKLTSILPPYMLRVWGSSLKFAFRLY